MVQKTKHTGAALVSICAVIGILILGSGNVRNAFAQTETPSSTSTASNTTAVTATATISVTPAATSAATSSATVEATPPTNATLAATSTACPVLPVPTSTIVPSGTFVTRTPLPTRVAPGYLGATGETSDDGCGVLIVQIQPDSVASGAGLRPGDIVIGITFSGDTRTTRDINILRDALNRAGVGAKVTLYAVRGKETLRINATLGERPALNLTPTLSVTP